MTTWQLFILASLSALVHVVRQVWSGFVDLWTRDKMQGNMEQYYAIKFRVKIKKTKQEAYGILQEAYEDE